MKRKILVLGGTRFFGKRLVHKLIENGDEITVATRGETEDDFGNTVTRIKVDRFDKESMKEAFSHGEIIWDVIYDQICFAPDDAKDSCEIFKGRVKKYVLTSTMAVYPFDDSASEKKVEKDFDPYSVSVKDGRMGAFDYAEGKRLAEAVFFQEASFPVIAARPPIVLGLDDYTERLHYYVRKVLQEEAIGIDPLDKKISFVDSDDLAQFLFWAGFNDLVGPVNTSAPDYVSLGDMIHLIEEKLKKKAHVVVPKTKEENSPMNFPVSIYQDVSVAEAAGYSFKPLSEWFEPLIEAIIASEK
ncbi:NAD-dependent epimerase/dehydratase family protein [Evansella tamaricis]|uniref:NAD-dependent epimerase/dehydratase family protein n=1 Tax=Evansella tamaricis TaxID=2069301 RepID=A0ABS6JPP5_9BACI|nr:NAD-dependent epimerase/dehydratase family protein [Evansella tamaricis]MBU9714787.1 NAD-dependent epimerase/dehydratase family protein [Evansella tamaricis]